MPTPFENTAPFGGTSPFATQVTAPTSVNGVWGADTYNYTANGPNQNFLTAQGAAQLAAMFGATAVPSGGQYQGGDIYMLQFPNGQSIPAGQLAFRIARGDTDIYNDMPWLPKVAGVGGLPPTTPPPQTPPPAAPPVIPPTKWWTGFPGGMGGMPPSIPPPATPPGHKTPPFIPPNNQQKPDTEPPPMPEFPGTWQGDQTQGGTNTPPTVPGQNPKMPDQKGVADLLSFLPQMGQNQQQQPGVLPNFGQFAASPQDIVGSLLPLLGKPQQGPGVPALASLLGRQ